MRPLYLYSAAVLLVCGAVALAAALAARGSPIPGISRTSRRTRQNLALVAAIAAIVAVTLVPTDGENRIRLIPLKDVSDALTPPFDRLLFEHAANMLLFVPLGAALRVRGLGLGEATIAAALSSAAVEVTQIAVSGRTTSIDDAFLYTLGAILGYSLAAACSSRVRESRANTRGDRAH